MPMHRSSSSLTVARGKTEMQNLMLQFTQHMNAIHTSITSYLDIWIRRVATDIFGNEILCCNHLQTDSHHEVSSKKTLTI